MVLGGLQKGLIRGLGRRTGPYIAPVRVGFQGVPPPEERALVGQMLVLPPFYLEREEMLVDYKVIRIRDNTHRVLIDQC